MEQHGEGGVREEEGEFAQRKGAEDATAPAENAAAPAGTTVRKRTEGFADVGQAKRRSLTGDLGLSSAAESTELAVSAQPAPKPPPPSPHAADHVLARETPSPNSPEGQAAGPDQDPVAKKVSQLEKDVCALKTLLAGFVAAMEAWKGNLDLEAFISRMELFMKNTNLKLASISLHWRLSESAEVFHRISQVQNDFIKDCKKRMEVFEGEMRALIEGNGTKIETAVSDMKEHLKDFEALIDTKIDTAVSDLKEQFKDFEVRIDTKLANFEARIDTKNKDFKARIDLKIDTAVPDLKEQFKDFEARIDTKLANFEARIDTKLDKAVARMEANNQELKALLLAHLRPTPTPPPV